MKKILLLLSFLLVFASVFSQQPAKLSTNQIYEKIQRLNFLGTALYIAAHPDDENTRLITYLANDLKARTAYLSLTRGDGGQNLIGPEMRELLGVIRTQELLAARLVDGGEQLFTSANDFGYSKHPDETFKIWNKKQVLADVVWVIRTFKPDIIINRFDHRTPRSTHGHHTSAAMLSLEAFDLAGDKSKFSNQLLHTNPWKPKRLFFNTSSWFYRNNDNFVQAAKDFTKVDVGMYYPLKGLSNNELASIASSKHLSQGFGRLTTRGSQMEYLEFLKGYELKDKSDIFSGINTTWNRVIGGEKIGAILYEVERNFDFVNPSKHLPKLMEAFTLIKSLNNEHWRAIKLKQIKEIIEACAGLYLEVSANSSSTVPNADFTVNIEALNRSHTSMEILGYTIFPTDKKVIKKIDLTANKKVNFKETVSLKEISFSTPYWLDKVWDVGMYKVDDVTMIGKPASPRPIKIRVDLNIHNTLISFTKNVVYRYATKDKGEIYEPFQILPRITTKLTDKVIIFTDDKAQKVAVEVRAGINKSNGAVSLKAPAGWQVSPTFVDFEIAQKGDIQVVNFMISPPKNQTEGILKVVAISKGEKYTKELIEINYDHIPKQSVLLPSEAKIVRLNIQKAANFIGYVQGSGDAVPESLRQIGYRVKEINPQEINGKNLQQFDAVVIGIRAYNTISELKFKQKYLLDYVKNGGNMIVQYNTTGRSRKTGVKAPYELNLSRDRVTDENAEVTVVAKDHSLVNFPNKITPEDFEGWVQERGLYFPDKWGGEFTPILSMNDEGETPKLGSLLVAKYGKGNYIYTGLSFFRELPAGVPGAYKLFTNMLSIGRTKIEYTHKIQN